MFCSNCGNKLVDGSKFCSGCGAKVGSVTEEKQTVRSDSVPHAASAYFEQGIEYLSQKDLDNAVNAFMAAIKIAPNYYEANKELAKVYVLCNKQNTAIKLLDKMLTERPDDAEAFYLRAEIYRQSNNIEQALMDLNIAKKIKPDFADVYGAYGIIFAERMDYKKAIDNFNEAIKLNPKEMQYYLNRGNVYYHEKLYDDAIKDYSSALAINKNNIACLYNRSMALFDVRKYDDALIDINKLLSKHPDNFDYLFLNGKICIMKEDYQKAISSFAYCITIMDNSEQYDTLEPFKYHAEACLKVGKYKDVREDYIRILEINSDYQLKSESCLIDGLVGYYEEALKKYKTEKNLYYE
jgi:tetratricopeptide (TPR) repeat protein